MEATSSTTPFSNDGLFSSAVTAGPMVNASDAASAASEYFIEILLRVMWMKMRFDACAPRPSGQRLREAETVSPSHVAGIPLKGTHEWWKWLLWPNHLDLAGSFTGSQASSRLPLEPQRLG